MPFAIGVYHTKTEYNIGTLMRSAKCFGANLVFTIGRRYKPQVTDTCKTYRSIPYINYIDWDDCKKHLPFRWVPIAVELCDKAKPIKNFIHPKSAIYLLGPEDGSIKKEIIEQCAYCIQIPTTHCLNVATAGSIVMYDRIIKEIK